MSVFLCTPEPCRIINYQYTSIRTIAVDLTADEYKLNAELRWNVVWDIFSNSHPLMTHYHFLKTILFNTFIQKKKNVVAYFQSRATTHGPFLLLPDCLLCDVGMNIFMECFHEAPYERLPYCVLLLQYERITHIPHSGQQSSSGS